MAALPSYRCYTKSLLTAGSGPLVRRYHITGFFQKLQNMGLQKISFQVSRLHQGPPRSPAVEADAHVHCYLTNDFSLSKQPLIFKSSSLHIHFPPAMAAAVAAVSGALVSLNAKFDAVPLWVLLVGHCAMVTSAPHWAGLRVHWLASLAMSAVVAYGGACRGGSDFCIWGMDGERGRLLLEIGSWPRNLEAASTCIFGRGLPRHVGHRGLRRCARGAYSLFF